MDNRRNIRNWDAFGTIYNFASRVLAAELFEPVLKFVFDLSAALLLGVTFIFQMLSVFIALDVVVLSFYQVTCSYCGRLFSALMTFITSERERSATVIEVIKYISNIFWVKVIYTVNPDCWTYMRGGPIFAAGLMHTLVGFYTERLNTEQNKKTQLFYGIFLTTLFMIVFNTLYLAPDHVLLETVFMLRVPIDTLCNSADTIFKLCDNALGVDNRLPVYTTQIARFSFWSAVHLMQFILVSTSNPISPALKARRADKYIYFFLFMHDLLELTVPVRHLLVQITNERYITKTFPKLTALELSALVDETCPVCLSEHTRDTVRLRCNHLLHAGCLHSILRQNADTMQASRCPMCRADIEIAPPATRTSHATGLNLFGTGMRGLRTRQRGHLYRSVQGAAHATATAATDVLGGTGIQATAGGRFGTAEQLIADHLQQHNLQHGDVVHIRIIPRNARQAAAGTTGNTSTSAIGAAGASYSGIPSTISTPTLNDTAAATVTQQRNLTTSTQTPVQSHPTRSQIEVDAERAIESIEQAERTSVLREIHRHGLYSESEGSSSVGGEMNSAGESVASQLNVVSDHIATAVRANSAATMKAVASAESSTPAAVHTSVSNSASTAAGLDLSHEELERMIQVAENIVYASTHSSTGVESNTQMDQDTQELRETQEMEFLVHEAEDVDSASENNSAADDNEGDAGNEDDESVAERSVERTVERTVEQSSVERSLEDDENTVVSTAHSDNGSDEESVDLLLPTQDRTSSSNAVASAENIDPTDIGNKTSPAGLKRKYSLVDLTASPPSSPERAYTARDRVIPQSNQTQVDGEYLSHVEYTQSTQWDPSTQVLKSEFEDAEKGSEEGTRLRKIRRMDAEQKENSGKS